eukprot:GHRQ01028771.1.p1 GENE.GHRQ01028771.1~~GHRQ01028771.1.p1  ORF type:complete len:174 (-),score=29.01 GHRQ01028771.1:152-673(-)
MHPDHSLTLLVLLFASQSLRRGSKRFLHRFDYGSECSNSSSAGLNSAAGGVMRCNMEVYGQVEPPVYDPAAITTPLALFTGTGWMCSACCMQFVLAGYTTGAAGSRSASASRNPYMYSLPTFNVKLLQNRLVAQGRKCYDTTQQLVPGVSVNTCSIVNAVSFCRRPRHHLLTG